MEWASAFARGEDKETKEWPVIAEVSPLAWEAEKKRLFFALDALQASIGALDSETLFAPLIPQVTETTRFVAIASILLHNAYHAGQITKLRDRHRFYEINMKL